MKVTNISALGILQNNNKTISSGAKVGTVPNVGVVSENNFNMPGYNKLGFFTSLLSVKNDFGVAFKSSEPGKFKLCSVDGLPCPACGIAMMPTRKFEQFKQELDESAESDYLKVISGFQRYMRPPQREVFKQVKAVMDNNPDLSLQRAIVKLRHDNLQILENVQYDILDEMSEEARTYTGGEKKQMTALIDDTIEQISKGDEVDAFRKKKFIAAIESIKFRNPAQKAEILEMANQMPSSSAADYAWIVKYSGRNKQGKFWSSREIAERFLSDSVANTDHVEARNGVTKGRNHIYNYLPMHTGCNMEKGNKPLTEWLDEDPNREVYLERFIKETDQYINGNSPKKHSKKYRNYPEKVAEHIGALSGLELASI